MNKQDFLNRFILQQPISGEPNHLLSSNVINPSNIKQLSKLSYSNEREKSPLKKAAVFMPLVQRKNGLHMIFTQRALHLRHHPGQVSFPGGRFETSDLTLANTALRETEEEIGIQKKSTEIIGKLAPIITTSGYHVTPFIGFIHHSASIIIDHNEVKECFEVPFSFLLKKESFSKHYFTGNKKRHFTYCCIYKNQLIWGATAQMLMSLQFQVSI